MVLESRWIHRWCHKNLRCDKLNIKMWNFSQKFHFRPLLLARSTVRRREVHKSTPERDIPCLFESLKLGNKDCYTLCVHHTYNVTGNISIWFFLPGFFFSFWRYEALWNKCNALKPFLLTPRFLLAMHHPYIENLVSDENISPLKLEIASRPWFASFLCVCVSVCDRITQSGLMFELMIRRKCFSLIP